MQVRGSERVCDRQKTSPFTGPTARKPRDEVQEVPHRLQVRGVVPRHPDSQKDDGRTSGNAK